MVLSFGFVLLPPLLSFRFRSRGPGSFLLVLISAVWKKKPK
jgi:hypothetical protein